MNDKQNDMADIIESTGLFYYLQMKKYEERIRDALQKDKKFGDEFGKEFSATYYKLKKEYPTLGFKKTWHIG